MAIKKEMSFNGQVYEFICRKLKLSPSDRAVLFRLLGFLIRNDKPFPYSAVSMSHLIGYDKRTIFRALNHLESIRLINRIGHGNNRRFSRGSIMDKVLSIVTNRTITKQVKNLTTATLCHKKLNNRDRVSYRKTSLSLKPKDTNNFFNKEYQEYFGRIKSDIFLSLIDKNTKILDYESWVKIKKYIS